MQVSFLLAVLAGCGSPATLTEVQEQVFTPSCSFSTCHGSAGTGDLVLTEGDSYGSLVGVAVADVEEEGGVGDEIRVIPGDVANSYLVKKLHDDPGIVGDPMPSPAGGLDPEMIRLVESWIADGAQDD